MEAPVITRLNEAELQGIAAAGRGTYTLLNNTDNAANKVMDEIEGMEQRNIWTPTFTDYTSFFQYFLGFAFIMLLIEFIFPASKIKKALGTKIKTTASVILLLVSAMPSAHAQQEKSLLKQGNQLYQQKKYKEAEQAYEKRL
jgi:hypothetical protein